MQLSPRLLNHTVASGRAGHRGGRAAGRQRNDHDWHNRQNRHRRGQATNPNSPPLFGPAQPPRCDRYDVARRSSASAWLGPGTAFIRPNCEWLTVNKVLPADVVTRNRRLAETVLRPWTPVFIHGDLQITHVFVDGDEVTGTIDWSEASQGDALFDLATLTLAHEEHLDDVVAGYGTDVDRDLIRAWWSMRCLLVVRWLAEHGYGTPEALPEVAVLRSRT
jgi:hypothetical protein